MNAKALLEMQKEVSQVFVHDAVYRYIVRLISATRQNTSFETGVSPRGTIALVKMAQASAWLKGNDFVTPVGCCRTVWFSRRTPGTAQRKSTDGRHQQRSGAGADFERYRTSCPQEEIAMRKAVYLVVCGLTFYLAGAFRLPALMLLFFAELFFFRCVVRAFPLLFQKNRADHPHGVCGRSCRGICRGKAGGHEPRDASAHPV